MNYRQYTKCASISAFVGFQWVQYVMLGGVAVIAGYLSYILGAAFVPGLLITILSAIITYCLWWLYDRLICLGGDVCAVGFVLSVETPDEKTGFDIYDTDYSVNLVIPPTLIGASKTEVEDSTPLGILVKETSDVAGYSFAGYTLPFSANLITKFPSGIPDPTQSELVTSCLHAEFEGGGVYDLLQSCQAALAFAIAAAVVCSIPVFGWIACVILSVVAAVITIAGFFNAVNDKGNPTDVNPNLTSIHAAESPDGYGADILVLKGTWVYDSAHTGWNEIHPIKQCQKIGTMIGQGWAEIQISDNPVVVQQITDIPGWISGWCKLLDTPNDPATVANQQLPQNQWTVHPLVDGCDPGSSPPR
jgi:hypothetical protein